MGGAIDQIDSEGLFEFSDLLAQRGCADEAPIGRPSEMSFVDDGDEAPNQTQIEVHDQSV
ncbi:hypothetical protein GOPIP_074_00180 [Gordonia polyisoprenivorans NBRC 16320 = JCM 10675]|nr:hypothetical protein GOPIP_074_00180 [Gordonia polyisoprenivorans NBRC 16320 = JCM 10675]